MNELDQNLQNQNNLINSHLNFINNSNNLLQQNYLTCFQNEITNKEQSFIDGYIQIMLKEYLELQNNKFPNKNVLEEKLKLLIKMNQFTNLKLNSMDGVSLNDYYLMNNQGINGNLY